MKCKRGFDVRAHKSAAGYYLGTWDDEGPRCRLTTTAEGAMENSFCNGGTGCEL